MHDLVMLLGKRIPELEIRNFISATIQQSVPMGFQDGQVLLDSYEVR